MSETNSSIDGFKRIEINKKLVCVFTDKGIARLIHRHRCARHTNLSNCPSCCHKDSIHGIETAVTVSQSILRDCLLS